MREIKRGRAWAKERVLKKKEKRVRLSNSIEKSSGSYYSVVFNWDLIDPSIIHCDCQWAVYAVYATSVSLSFPRILTTKYILCFSCFFFVLHFYLYFFSFVTLSFPFDFATLIRASFAIIRRQLIRLYFRFVRNERETKSSRKNKKRIYMYIYIERILALVKTSRDFKLNLSFFGTSYSRVDSPVSRRENFNNFVWRDYAIRQE